MNTPIMYLVRPHIKYNAWIVQELYLMPECHSSGGVGQYVAE